MAKAAELQNSASETIERDKSLSPNKSKLDLEINNEETV
jgi:hypothetical protein